MQDTPEYQEAERARRARQKLPSAKQRGWAKTKGERLRQIDGEVA